MKLPSKREQLEMDWRDWLYANPSETIDMLAVILSVLGIERIPDEQEKPTPQGDQISEQSTATEGTDGGSTEKDSK